MARELAQAGFRVVVLEQGPGCTRRTSGTTRSGPSAPALTNDHRRSRNTRREATPERRRSGRRVDLRPRWSAAAPCTSPRTTGASTRSTSTSAACSAPIAGTGFADWPITYAELEPYYTKVEWEIGVSGLAGASPFDPPRSQAVSDAAAAGEVVGRAARARRAQARAGTRSRRRWRSTRSRTAAAPACVHCGFCHGFGCEVRREVQSTLATVIPEAEATGRCEVRPESYVARIEIDKRGRATGVAYFDRDGRERFQRARAVVVCANGAETPRLLLMSSRTALPARPREFERAGRQVPHVQLRGARARRCSSTSSTSTRACRSRASCTTSTSSTRSAASTAAAASTRASACSPIDVRARRPAAATRRAWGAGVQERAAASSPRTMLRRSRTRTSLPVESQQRHARSRREGRVGPARDPRHLQGPSGRPATHTVPAGPRRSRSSSRRRAAKSGAARRRTDVLACTCSAPAAWANDPATLGGRPLPPQPRRAEPVPRATAAAS